jgi:hypothetical protein
MILIFDEPAKKIFALQLHFFLDTPRQRSLGGQAAKMADVSISCKGSADVQS